MATITGSKERGYDYTCPDCGFKSSRHPTRKSAKTAEQVHTDQHDTGKAAD